MFSEHSGLVTVWVNLIRAGVYDAGKIPEISNLREMAEKVLSGAEG